jgi:S-methylmethionine-dependent homocysteine/selenocysteine methylase
VWRGCGSPTALNDASLKHPVHDVASLTLHDDGVRSSFTEYLWARASVVASACAQTSTPTVMSNVPLQLTGDSMKEVVVVAALARTVSNFHLPGQDVARS